MSIQLLRDIKNGSGLVGEELGNCHIDFSMDGAFSEIYAIASFFPGRKFFLYILESKHKEGKPVNS